MELRGVGVGRGLAVGPVLRMPDPLPEPGTDGRVGDAPTEVATVRAAMAAVAADLDSRAARTEGQARAVLEAASMMAVDPMVVDDVTRRIEEGRTGERAVFEAFAAFRDTLSGIGGYHAERVSDLADVSQRVIATLRGVPAPAVPASDEPFILVAHDLAPADTALLDLDRVLALVTRHGGPTSHTAILARERSIPAIVGVTEALELTDGMVVIADAAVGVVITHPSQDALAAARATVEQRRAEVAPAALPLAPGALADGTTIPLLANLGSPADAAAAVALGAEGVGLLRTEVLFLGATRAPTVAEQERHYVELLRHFAGRKVVVRVLDAGADKPLSFLAGGHEENPALGLRGLRALRANPSILTDQLQALANAQKATDAELWVMAPMVADAAEAAWFVDRARAVGLSTVGVMAEIPALALAADHVAEVADFISIGTNDLTQYALAADRMLGSLAGYQDPWHPSVLRLIAMLADAGTAARIPVGVCGEAAADPALAVVLVGLGCTSLSMAPAAFADVRAELLTVTLAEARARASRALAARTAAEARDSGSS